MSSVRYYYLPIHPAEELFSHPVRMSCPLVEKDELDGVGDEPRDVAEHEQHHHQDRSFRVTGVPLLLSIEWYFGRGFWVDCCFE